MFDSTHLIIFVLVALLLFRFDLIDYFLSAAENARPALYLLALVYQIVDEVLHDLLSLFVLVAVEQYFGVCVLVGQMHQVEGGVLPVDVVHDAVDLVHLCFELYAHHFGFPLVPGYDFGGFLFYVVGGELVGGDVVDGALVDPLGLYVGCVVDECGCEGVDVYFSGKKLNFVVHAIIKLVGEYRKWQPVLQSIIVRF